jgi:hypothetical protein
MGIFSFGDKIMAQTNNPESRAIFTHSWFLSLTNFSRNLQRKIFLCMGGNIRLLLNIGFIKNIFGFNV